MPDKIAVRIHGRGGQGVVTAAELMAMAAWEEGLYAQAFPTFGSERMGAPVAGFVRLSHQPVHMPYQVYEPRYVIVQDSTLVGAVDLTSGLEADGLVLVNTEGDSPALALSSGVQLVTVPATRIALEELGQNRPNTALLGAFAALTGLFGLAAIEKAVSR
ncbi:MAG TPA: pyruvate ferredoxin oxidoreductase, partial [Firmicutes bacterium]|nr:pyruvate ferredoxin oxidoreductase [Bacillota bacterium]